MAAKKTQPESAAPEAYRVINLKYRPQTFADVVGQRHVVGQLQGEIRDNRVGHAYLFTGPRGVGKTSMARIFAKALNCVEGPTPAPCGKCTHCIGITNDSDLDVVEVDAATYTKKDETVELLEGIDRAAFNARCKVYIIDEVHMFSTHSFNVLLKRLEEPPPGVVFILATTNPEKIPETVISRCRRLEFDRMDATDIVGRLQEIAEKEKVAFNDDEKDKILEAIALASEGGMRDAQVALDQLISLSEGTVSLEKARQLLGIVESDLLHSLLEGLVQRDTAKCLLVVQDLAEKGRDLQRFIKTFTVYLRDGMLLKAGAPRELLKVTRADPAKLNKAVDSVSMPVVLNFMQQFLELEERMKSAAPARFLLEFTLIKLTAIHPHFVLDAMDSRTLSRVKAEAPDSEPGDAREMPTTPTVSRVSLPIEERPSLVARPTGDPPAAPPIRARSAAPRRTMVMRSPGGAEAAEYLADVEVGEVHTDRPIAESIDEFKGLASQDLPVTLRGALQTSAVSLQRSEAGEYLSILLVSGEAVVRPMFDRPETVVTLRQAVQRAFGGDLRIVVDVDKTPMPVPADREDPEDSEFAAALAAYSYEEEAEQESAAKATQRLSFEEALSRFPDFREAIELVRKHCGAPPVLFNGQRI